jgi:hypothetical protein
MPPELSPRLDQWVAEKDALRAELAAAVISADRAKFASSRRRTLEQLARTQGPRLAALETRAEEIRRDYAPHFELHRMRRPLTLPPEVLAVIEAFERRLARILERLERHTLQATARVHMSYRGNSRSELQMLRAKANREATAEFHEVNHDELVALNVELENVRTVLVACVGEAALAVEGGAPDAFLTTFMSRYRQDWAYYEYEVAIFEPGLSPPQRRLLVGGAIRGLDLPLPRGELQPTSLPLTLLNDELKEAAGLKRR